MTKQNAQTIGNLVASADQKEIKDLQDLIKARKAELRGVDAGAWKDEADEKGVGIAHEVEALFQTSLIKNDKNEYHTAAYALRVLSALRDELKRGLPEGFWAKHEERLAKAVAARGAKPKA